MRAVLYGSAALAVVTLCSPSAIRGALATSASALVEATPFLLAGILLTSFFQRAHNAAAIFGCGCGFGPSARSLPAAAVTWLAFGPLVAISRFIAAMLVAQAMRRRNAGRCHADKPQLLGELDAMLPAVLVAGATAPMLAQFNPATLPFVGNALAGAILGFVASPCGLGAIALATALRMRAPVAAAAFLCVAGIVDLRALRSARSHRRVDHDALAYAMLAAALAFIAWKHGDALVHPAFSLALWIGAGTALLLAIAHARRQSAAARFAPALMLVGALIGAPAPAYHATQTSLSDLFAGERITFSGMLSCEPAACAIVRYAITCCRADATPIAIRLSHPLRSYAGSWLRIDGRMDDVGGDLRLVPDQIKPIVPPTDPFVYR